MNIRHSLLLTCALGTSVFLSACSSDENLQLGSRDDIVIMKNGIPVDGSTPAPNLSDVAVETAEVMVPEVEEEVDVVEAVQEDTVEQVEEVKQVAVEETQEVVAETTDIEDKVTEMVEEKAVEPVTEIEMADTAATDQIEEEIEEIVETAQEELAEKMQSTPMKQEMKQPKSVNTELMTAELAEDIAQDVVEQNLSQPMASTPMKSAMVKEEKPATEETAAKEEKKKAEAKVEGGCYRNMLISTTQAIPVLEERRIVCEKDLTPSLVAIIQQALINRGADIGSADGKLGNKTMNAIEAYQSGNGLAVGGVTFEILDDLGIKI